MPLLTSLSRGVLTLTLNRPEKHNALNAQLLDELHAALLDAQANDAVRVIVLTGAGASFCAGADIANMRAMRDASEGENLDDARRVAQCMRALDEVERPVIARVNGNVFGGGVGLIACCDIAIGVLRRRTPEFRHTASPPPEWSCSVRGSASPRGVPDPPGTGRACRCRS